jgi:hypothetical protein
MYIHKVYVKADPASKFVPDIKICGVEGRLVIESTMATPVVIAAALQDIEYGHLRCNFDTIYTADTPEDERKIVERLNILNSVFKSILLTH